MQYFVISKSLQLGRLRLHYKNGLFGQILIILTLTYIGNNSALIRPNGENMFKTVVVIILGVLSLIYIFNPGAGIFEIIPDNIPFLGNLDEATAVMILLACLRYFGIDIGNIFKRRDIKQIDKD